MTKEHPLDYIDEVTWDVTPCNDDELYRDSPNMTYEFLKDEDITDWI